MNMPNKFIIDTETFSLCKKGIEQMIQDGFLKPNPIEKNGFVVLLISDVGMALSEKNFLIMSGVSKEQVTQ